MSNIVYEIGDVVSFLTDNNKIIVCEVTDKMKLFVMSKDKTSEVRRPAFDGKVIDSSEYIDHKFCWGWERQIISINHVLVKTV